MISSGGGDIYAVTGIEVDRQARSAALARNLALREAKYLAFSKLFTRLTRRDYNILNEGEGISNLDSYIDDFEILEEKTTPRRYLAKLKYRFNRKEVREYLLRHHIPFSETRSKPILILPLYKEGGALHLWDTQNEWRKILEEGRDLNSLVPLILPAKDFPGYKYQGASLLEKADQALQTALMRQYEVKSIFIGLAEKSVNVLNGRPMLKLAFWRMDARDKTFLERQYGAEIGENIESLMRRAVQDISAYFAEAWTHKTMVSSEEEYALKLIAPIDDLKNWAEVQQRLANVPTILNFRINELSVDKVKIALTYVGSWEILGIGLEQAGLALQEGEDADNFTLRMVENIEKTKEKQ